MTLSREDIRNAVKMVTIKRVSTTGDDRLSATNAAFETGDLPVKGQGAVAVWTKEDNTESFSVILSTKRTGGQGFKFVVGKDTVTFSEVNPERALKSFSGTNIGLDPDKTCRYWFSLDYHNRRLSYGKGEMRRSTLLAEYDLPKPPEDSDVEDPYLWVDDVAYITASENVRDIQAWRDPVTIEPPVQVIPVDKMTMDVAANCTATVPSGLTSACQALYGNISGKSFTLNTPDFPFFTDAIEYSIRNENGWCHKKLIEKSSEFGEKNILATYLRITLGVNQGNSPGVPYVLEIWPPNHYSPIHNHADADAIIRVLHGEITVNLYSMLSEYHKEPFATAKFEKENVTWLSPQLNQTHQLKNCNSNGPTCMTIQCYQYGAENTTHYEYFDYLDESTNTIKKFNPTSDMGFDEFKKLMRKEWEAR